MGISISALVPELQPYCRELVSIAGENRLAPRLTSTRRSLQEQRDLYDRYLRGINPYPVAAPGSSAHETGEAFDLLVTPVDYLQDLGAIWKSWGGAWGGNRDPVHFQLPGAPSAERLAELKGPQIPDLYQAGIEALPDWTQKLLPWQAKLYRDNPIIRPLVNPTWGAEMMGYFFGEVLRLLS